LTLVDTSAWIEFLRKTESPVDLLLDRMVRSGERLVTTEPVMMELLAGAREPIEERVARGILDACRLEKVRSRDWEIAAAIYAGARQRGTMLREQIDCLIAAVAIRASIPVLTADSDFELIAEHAPLQLAR
jgi:predicted nucleic acid-binding protein